jgi:tRNA (guanine37-N1)-methyltransferase
VDDVPYGGGPGMVFKPEPVFKAIESLKNAGGIVILPEPQGEIFTQRIAEELASMEQLIFICARYEGIDERIRENVVDREISVGDFVTMGGELPALLMVESISRFVPGVVGDLQSLMSDSFQNSLLDFPHYTRPSEFRNQRVPEILLSGNHEQIRRWRRKMSLQRTLQRRPDLLRQQDLSKEDRELLEEVHNEVEPASGRPNS